MNFDNLSDDDLDNLRTMAKRVTNPGSRWSEKPGHSQRNLKVASDRYQFELYQRQNLNDETDFSCGLRVIKPDGTSLTLCRYNGSSHAHGEIEYRCHIHKATAEEISAGRKPEGHADETDRYSTLSGATYCIMLDCTITGFKDFEPDQPNLFQA
ncbi:hypothetical protein FE236_00620 [Mariprofundus erugo]|uniref:hypothetical protein n=1 Tax=Mariprofundus erugo TaxID=2528639 RepID=UPI0010FE865F|nr:hypothetical protein [Mariprofundus erugo]TLS78297.1 hypothetical protein FE236_00620 [Mariprofundus erugo]